MPVRLAILASFLMAASPGVQAVTPSPTLERQVTTAATNHVLTNIGVWSPDGGWIYYDVRSDAAGSVFDGRRIERVHVASGQVEVVFESVGDACCGVVTACPVDDRVVLIHGPENPTDDWQYAAYHRRGVVAGQGRGASAINLDARNLSPPFTPGALRGGSHVHVFSGDGEWVSFTYEDHVLATSQDPQAAINQRNVGVATPFGPVHVPRTHPRNHDGDWFSVLVTRTTDNPQPGTDQISRAYSDAWVGRQGYLRSDGVRQRRAIAFLGDLVTEDGDAITELFIVDIPDDPTIEGAEPLAGTPATRPTPPRGTRQRRLTRTVDRRHPGVRGPRHWPRSSPHGDRVAFLMQDDAGIVQLHTVSPLGGAIQQLTRNAFGIDSAFSWHPTGTRIAVIAGGSVCEVDTTTGATHRLTTPSTEFPLRPEACVYAPDGSRIAHVRRVSSQGGDFNQIYVVPSR